MECLELSRSVERRHRSRSEKQQIMEEASVPGVSVAEVARRHDVNANLVFKWLRDAGQGRGASRGSAAVPSAASDVLEFVPLGVFAREGEMGGSGASLALAPPAKQPPASRPIQPSAPKLEERAGVIEIDLPGGARVRVDAFVNQGALRRVLQAMKEQS
jgi:transposase